MKAMSICTVAGIAGLLFLTPLRAAENRGSLSEKDYKFAEEASRGSLAEVKLGELAKQKGTTQAVKDFGERMVTDHGKANQELSAILARKNATPPTDLSRKDNSTFERLQKATGKDFDEDYTEAMVKDHKTDVKEFKDAASSLQDPDLRAFASKTLPTLQEHLTMAEQLHTSTKK